MEARDLKGILDSLDDIIIFSDGGGMIQFVNYQASSIIEQGYAAIGRSIFCAVEEKYHPLLRENMEKIRNGENNLPLFDGDKYKISLKAVKNRKEQFLGFLLWHEAQTVNKEK